MVAIASRIAKLEAKHGLDTDRWLKSLSEEQIEARISELTLQIRAGLMAAGVDCSDMSDEQVCHVAHQMVVGTEAAPLKTIIGNQNGNAAQSDRGAGEDDDHK